MTRYPKLSEAEWRKCGENAKQVKALLNELLLVKIPRCVREPHILRAMRNVDKFCNVAEDEMLKQHPEMKDATKVFYGR